MSTKHIQIILHNPKGSTGIIGAKLTAKGHKISTRYPLHGDTLPPLDEYDAVIVFGGKMSVNDCDGKHPSIHSELNWIRQTVEAKKPYLGICLGGQLLARAFGGRVSRHNRKYVEIGYYTIYPTVEGFNDIFATAPEKFFQWHNEGFSLPNNAVKLAASDLYPNQAFRIGKHAYGFQFHPEVTLPLIETWHDCYSEDLTNARAQTVPTQLRDNKTYTPLINQWLDTFLDHWLCL